MNSTMLMSKKVLIWGCGSIGLRHARLTDALGYTPVCLSSRTDLPFLHVQTLDDALTHGPFALTIIATPTALHGEHLQHLHRVNSALILVEKPLFALPERVALPLPEERIFVAYNLRFHPAVCRLRELLAGKRLLSLHLHVGQYLPSWRPEQDYTQGYSASKKNGGGALRDLSHELDLAGFLAGHWLRVAALGGKTSHLAIDSDDSYTLLAEHASCPQVSIHMDYLQTPARRVLTAVVENGSFVLDFMAGTLSYADHLEHFPLTRDITYSVQLQTLLEAAPHTSNLPGMPSVAQACSYRAGVDNVAYIVAAEHAAQSQQWVYR